MPLAAGGIAYFGGALAIGAIPVSMRSALLGALRPRSLDRMEAEAAAVGEQEGLGVAPSGPTVGPFVDPDRVPSALDAETTVLPARVPGSREPSDALDAETTQMRPAAMAGAGRGRGRRDAADVTDLPTMELDLAALQTIRMRQQGKYVDLRVIRRG